jgi:hypothetical protein
MNKAVHAVAGATALLATSAFWLATLLSEVLGSAEAVTAVKVSIPWGLLLLIPALATAGGSGFVLGRSDDLTT